MPHQSLWRRVGAECAAYVDRRKAAFLHPPEGMRCAIDGKLLVHPVRPQEFGARLLCWSDLGRFGGGGRTEPGNYRASSGSSALKRVSSVLYCPEGFNNAFNCFWLF